MSTTTATVEAEAREVLARVADPEIPVCSIADLGMIQRVEATDVALEVDLLPTFIGCPAKDIIGQDAERALREVAGGREIRVRFVHAPPWTTERITPAGREALRSFGIAPHWERAQDAPLPIALLRPAAVACPYCGSAETVQESAFGPTPCRAQHFCRSCRNPFEGFKEK